MASFTDLTGSSTSFDDIDGVVTSFDNTTGIATTFTDETSSQAGAVTYDDVFVLYDQTSVNYDGTRLPIFNTISGTATLFTDITGI